MGGLSNAAISASHPLPYQDFKFYLTFYPGPSYRGLHRTELFNSPRPLYITRLNFLPRSPLRESWKFTFRTRRISQRFPDTVRQRPTWSLKLLHFRDTYNGDGKKCKLNDFCTNKQCGPNAMCISRATDAICKCEAGYRKSSDISNELRSC